MKNKNIWVVIPGYNESKYIEKVLKKTLTFTKNIIFVDDGSKDETVKLAEKYLKYVLVHPVNLGKGAALKTGSEFAFKKLNADAVIFMDSDDQHDPKELDLFIEKLEHNSDVVFGVRSFDKNMPLIRIAMNRLASYFILLLFGTYIPDIPSGFKALSKNAYKKVVWKSRDYSVELELAVKVAKYKIHFSTVDIRTVYHDLDRGMTILDVMRMITNILTWRISL